MNDKAIIRDFEVAVRRAGIDVFDFSRSRDKHGNTQCPRCSERADLYRLDETVVLTCPECSAGAEWKCSVENNAYGGTGCIRLVNAHDGNSPKLATDEM